MVSFISTRQLMFPVVSSSGVRLNFKIRPRVELILVKKVRVFGCEEVRERRIRSGLFCCCKGYSDEMGLEREILVFMKSSRNPNEFPSKQELLDAGRGDLVDGISKVGGWLALGWDCSDDDNDCDEDVRELQTPVEEFEDSDNVYDSSSGYTSSSQQEDSPTDRSLEMLAEEDTGIEGILSRLEKHRSLSFDIHMEKNMHASSKDNGAFTDSYTATDVAAKIDPQLQERQGNNQNNNNKDLDPDKIKSRLQHMQLELSSAINSLRSKNLPLIPEVNESRGSELQQLSDVWEFKENEVMKAGDKLRSLRAKLAVLEGKIALSVIDSHKLVEEKQRRIDSAHKTLHLLRTTCIYWTHSASEVLLVGSYDGWTAQVKMEKTKTGIFSTSLRLYPGRYEIKFIVDGIWRLDRMLPVVHNNGYDNNCLIVHE